MNHNKLQLHSFIFSLQNVEMRCAEQLRTFEVELSDRQQEVKRSLMDVKNQTSSDRTVLDHQQAELQGDMQTSQQLVHSFLQEELQQDVPTGTRINLVSYSVLSLCFYGFQKVLSFYSAGNSI